MPQLRIINESGIGFGTQAFLDGRLIPDVRDIKLHFGLDEAVTADVEVLVTEALDLTVPASVTILMQVPEGCELIDVTKPGDKGTVTRCVRTRSIEDPFKHWDAIVDAAKRDAVLHQAVTRAQQCGRFTAIANACLLLAMQVATLTRRITYLLERMPISASEIADDWKSRGL